MALPTVADVNNQVRYIVADTGTDYLTDAYLLPYVQRAYRKASRYLRSAGMRLLVKDSADINIAAIGTSLTRGTAPMYPSDLLRPLVLREKPTSVPPATQYTQMSQNQEVFPDRTATTLREIWDWRNDIIYFPASSVAGVITIRYEAELPALTGNGSEILIPDGMDAVALLAAAYAAQARDEQNNSAAFIKLALEDLDLILGSELGAKTARAATFGRQ